MPTSQLAAGLGSVPWEAQVVVGPRWHSHGCRVPRAGPRVHMAAHQLGTIDTCTGATAGTHLLTEPCPCFRPDGFTPLMIASCSGGGLETGNSEEEEDAPAVISDFIYQGASLHNQTDRTGETALHLAARYSRSDAAKRLLEASADANIQDNMGRTPLHAAVSADAQGVFQVGSCCPTCPAGAPGPPACVLVQAGDGSRGSRFPTASRA